MPTKKHSLKDQPRIYNDWGSKIVWDNPCAISAERRIWHSPCLQASHHESEIKCRYLRSKLVRKDRIWQLVIPDKCRNSVRGIPGLGGSGDSWEEVRPWSTLAARIRMPQRGWGRHAEHNTWHLPSTEQGSYKWTGASVFGEEDYELQGSRACAQLSAHSR